MPAPSGAWNPSGRTVVVLCSDAAEPPVALDVAGVADALRRRDLDVRPMVDVCADPRHVAQALSPDISRLVVGCRQADDVRDDVVTLARRHGLPFDAVDVVALVEAHEAGAAGAGDTDVETSALRALRAAVAGVEAHRYPLRSAEHAVRSRSTSRRRPLGDLALRPLPTLSAAACRSSTGCSACVPSCCRDAITVGATGPQVDTTACASCGACVTTCPVGAWRLPGWSATATAARLQSLLHPDDGPAARAIEVRCRDSSIPRLPAGDWAELAVPSLEAVSIGLVMQALGHGGCRVRLSPCADERCRARAAALADLSRRLVRDDRAVGTADDPPAPLGPIPGVPLADGPLVASEPAATLILSRAGWGAVRVTDPLSTVAEIGVDGTACSGCGACVRACPTGALRASDDGARWRLGYDPRACAACGVCAAVCPESALEVRPVIDTRLLRSGDVELCVRTSDRCPGCGGPMPDGAVRRVAAARLAGSPAADVARTCGHCGPAAFGCDPTARAGSALR